jgi:1,4-alpha-glucan branching enzyme
MFKIRYRLSFGFALLLFSIQLFSQTVVTIPVYPTDLDSCTVIYDATKGNGELENVPPPIYAHTGVITSLSTSPTDWRYVIANWNENIPKALMTPLGNNLYQLKLLPSIRAFYGVPQGETILKLAFVFRNSDGSKVGREANGSDIYADVYSSEFTITLSQPQNRELYLPQEDSIAIYATSPLADSLFLYVNNNLLKAVAGPLITDTIPADNFGSFWTQQWVKITAKNDTAAVADSFFYAVLPPPPIADLPAGMSDGINYIDSTTVLLCLYAPAKEFCFVTGDFTGWEIDSSFFMNRTPDSLRYWLRIGNLIPRHEYIFQYLVEGNLRIADPYCDKVSDPDDQYIPSYTYPDLIPYPTGKTTGIAGVLETARIPYSWQTVSFTPPKATDLVIYELLIRDFTSKHDYPSLIDTLNYLKRLGVNAIELMPVMEFEGNISWGYNPDFLFAPDKYYGTREGLKQFIDAAHASGIAVILDIVLNHQFGKSPLVRLYWDEANNRPAENNPWFNPIPRHPYNVGYDMNHESQQTQAYCERLIRYWITEYHADGYRFDLSKGFTQRNSYPDNVSLWGQYDANRIAILNDYSNAIRSVKPDAILILEHFANNDEETELSGDGMLLWGNMNGPYSNAAMGYNQNNNSDFSWISYKQRGWAQPHVVGYMESHDEERMMYRNITWGNVTNPDYLLKDTTLALKRMEMAAAFFYTVPGPKMLWQFGELGYDYSINYPCGPDCRLSPKPIRWDYYSQWRRRYLYNTVAALTELKKSNDAFELSTFTLTVSGALKRINIWGAPMDVTIVGNFDVNDGEINPAFHHTGTWYDFFSGDSISVVNTTDPVTLEPGEFHIYTSVRLQKPLFTGTGDEPVRIDDSKHGITAFPNPASGIITVVSGSEITLIELYSLTGKKMLSVQGKNTMDLSGLASGIYFLKVSFKDSSSETIKIARE